MIAARNRPFGARNRRFDARNRPSGTRKRRSGGRNPVPDAQNARFGPRSGKSGIAAKKRLYSENHFRYLAKAMIDEFANRQAMHLTVVNLLDDLVHSPVWLNQNPTMFTTKSLLFRQKVTELTVTIAKQEAELAGRAEQKDREETELIAVAHELGQALADFLIDKGREAEAAEIDLSLNKWRRLRDTALLAKATLLQTRLNDALLAHPDDLLTYGLEPADLTRLGTELGEYGNVIESPSAGIATRKALTAALRPAFREVSLILKSMDRLVLRFRTTPEGIAFADNWKTARVVRDLGTNNPEPPAPPTP